MSTTKLQVTISEEYAKLLYSLSDKYGISVSSLCAKYIVDSLHNELIKFNDAAQEVKR